MERRQVGTPAHSQASGKQDPAAARPVVPPIWSIYCSHRPCTVGHTWP